MFFLIIYTQSHAIITEHFPEIVVDSLDYKTNLITNINIFIFIYKYI